jgi:hypothetical protein
LYVGFEVLTAVVMRFSIFWDIKPLSEPYSKKSSACHLLHAGLLLGLFFDPEDGGDMFLGNVDLLSAVYTALYPRR